jgi:hypothetical protein
VYIFEVSGNADQCNTSPAHTREKGIDMIKVSVVATVTLELEVDLVDIQDELDGPPSAAAVKSYLEGETPELLDQWMADEGYAVAKVTVSLPDDFE